MSRCLAVAVLVPIVVVAGCSSSGSKSGGSSSPAPITTSGSGTGSASAVGSPAANALAAKMRAGLTGLTSAHVDVDAGTLGGKSAGDFTFAGGKSTASTITVSSGTEKTKITTVGTTSYARLPKGRNTTGKPWVKVSATSKNEFVRALASTLNLSQAAASLPAVAGVVATASSVKDKGTTTVAGVGAHHYALVIDPLKSSGTTLGTLLSDIGQKSVPVDLYLDADGRPVSVLISVKIGTQTFDFTVAAGKFNAPLHISAPPANQVSSD